MNCLNQFVETESASLICYGCILPQYSIDMSNEDLNRQLCEWIEQLRQCVPSECVELLNEAAYHEERRNELRNSAKNLASSSKEWVNLTDSAKKFSSRSQEYRQVMRQARAIAPTGYEEKMSQANDHDQKARNLKETVKQGLPRSATYRKLLTKIVSSLQTSNVIHNPRYIAAKINKTVPYHTYSDALANTYLWFCENLCRYENSKGSVINWFNNRLQYAVREEILSSGKAIVETDLSQRSEEGDGRSFFDTKADGKQSSFAAIEMNSTFETILQWLKEKRHELERERLRDYPQVTCHSVIVRMVPTLNQETQSYDSPPSFSELATELGVPKAKLQRFFNEKCRKKLQKFIE